LPDSSTEISNKVDDWKLGFEFSPISASHSPLPGPKSESNQTGDGLTMFNQTFGKLANAHSWPGPNQSLVGFVNIVLLILCNIVYIIKDYAFTLADCGFLALGSTKKG
jgi:hypothetical protein